MYLETYANITQKGWLLDSNPANHHTAVQTSNTKNYELKIPRALCPVLSDQMTQTYSVNVNFLKRSHLD